MNQYKYFCKIKSKDKKLSCISGAQILFSATAVLFYKIGFLFWKLTFSDTFFYEVESVASLKVGGCKGKEPLLTFQT